MKKLGYSQQAAILFQIYINSMGSNQFQCCQTSHQDFSFTTMQSKKPSHPHTPAKSSIYHQPQHQLLLDIQPKTSGRSSIQPPPPASERNYSQSSHQQFSNELHQKILGWNDFNVSHMIGQGAVGQVFLATLKQSPQSMQNMKLVIKRMKKEYVKSKNMIENIKIEKCILQTSHSQFITRFFTFFRDERHYYLVMEWASEGDIFSFIRPRSSRKNLFRAAGQQAIRFILACVVMSLEYLHGRNIIYADLKPENILIFQDGYVKLADFGLSQKVQEDINIEVKLGSPLYFAPETAYSLQCKCEIDLWALGVLAYELAYFVPPFTYKTIMDLNAFASKVVQRQNKKRWEQCHPSQCPLEQFIHGLLKLQPSERLGAKGWSQIKNHSFFTSVGFDWKELQLKKMQSPLIPILKEKVQYKKYEPNLLEPLAFEVDERSSNSFWNENIIV